VPWVSLGSAASCLDDAAELYTQSDPMALQTEGTQEVIDGVERTTNETDANKGYGCGGDQDTGRQCGTGLGTESDLGKCGKSKQKLGLEVSRLGQPEPYALP